MPARPGRSCCNLGDGCGSALDCGSDLRARIAAEVGLPASAGKVRE